jgi:hypothetical protein
MTTKFYHLDNGPCIYKTCTIPNKADCTVPSQGNSDFMFASTLTAGWGWREQTINWLTSVSAGNTMQRSTRNLNDLLPSQGCHPSRSSHMVICPMTQTVVISFTPSVHCTRFGQSDRKLWATFNLAHSHTLQGINFWWNFAPVTSPSACNRRVNNICGWILTKIYVDGDTKIPTAVTNKAFSYIEMMQAVHKIGIRWFANDVSVTPR